MQLKQAIKHATQGSVLFSPLRDAYQRTFNRSYWSYRQRMASFFSQFISRNDLVFDVGANIGEYTDVFVNLGARVVAIEPNPTLAPLLKAIRPFDRVTVESVAVGSSEGSADLYSCGKDFLATLSPKWISVAKQSERFSGLEWNQKTLVPVLTLDMLVQKYGTPQFIKIDVEGFETDVLAGLSRTPRFLSFEFNTEFAEAALACIGQDCFPSGTEYNVSFELSMKFIYDQWVCRDEIVRFLEGPELAKTKTYGDVYVRRSQ